MKLRPRPTPRRPLLSLLAAALAVATLASCGSSSSNSSVSNSDIEDENALSNEMDTGIDTEPSSTDFDGTGTVTLDGTTFEFNLLCAFGPDTMNEDVSIAIKGVGDDGIELSFTQMLGYDFTTAQLSADVPPAHSITIYKMPGVVLMYEYLSLVDKLLDVSGNTVSGTVQFAKSEDGTQTSGQPNYKGEVDLRCD
jgi:hypothetical protein